MSRTPGKPDRPREGAPLVDLSFDDAEETSPSTPYPGRKCALTPFRRLWKWLSSK
jgi:hypothetical protein